MQVKLRNFGGQSAEKGKLTVALEDIAKTLTLDATTGSWRMVHSIAALMARAAPSSPERRAVSPRRWWSTASAAESSEVRPTSVAVRRAYSRSTSRWAR